MSEKIEEGVVIAQNISDILDTSLNVASLLLPQAYAFITLGRLVARFSPKLYATVAKLIAGEPVDPLELENFRKQLGDLGNPEVFYKEK